MDNESLSSNSQFPKGKVCNCKYSKCLKLYCECFSSGEYCFDCNCNNCFNNSEHEETRSLRIKAILDRDPFAFRPKIPKAPDHLVVEPAAHFKGCNCKKTKCTKKYCECFNAKIPCSSICKCRNCKNTDIDKPKDKNNYTPPINEYFKTLAEPLVKKIEKYEEAFSEENSTLCEDSLAKITEIGSYEKFEEYFYAKILLMLNGLS
ncbi:hypothetical protein SteCoe_15828 [Stentor coeruleus]|uniref:CRC domain-containing protein n=1 Tax=Stentor coeruleus TaxID=5963 RepID=A0A1R2C2P2_9CILI|nr:hypothetical protein SteCoe_15828 [Stentor coeruleus]